MIEIFRYTYAYTESHKKNTTIDGQEKPNTHTFINNCSEFEQMPSLRMDVLNIMILFLELNSILVCLYFNICCKYAVGHTGQPSLALFIACLYTCVYKCIESGAAKTESLKLSLCILSLRRFRTKAYNVDSSGPLTALLARSGS